MARRAGTQLWNGTVVLAYGLTPLGSASLGAAHVDTRDQVLAWRPHSDHPLGGSGAEPSRNRREDRMQAGYLARAVLAARHKPSPQSRLQRRQAARGSCP